MPTSCFAFLMSAFVSRLLPQRSTATSRLYRPCRSSHSLHSTFQFFYEMFTLVPSSNDQARSRLNRSERLVRFSNGRGRLRLNWSDHLALLSIDSRVSRPCLAPFLCCSRSASGCLQELRRSQQPADVSLA